MPRIIDLGHLSPSDGLKITSWQSYSGAGSAGDVNGDGLTDLIMTAGNSAYVLFGKVGGFSETQGTFGPADGFRISPPVTSDPYESVGTAAFVGDVNGDGFADIAVGVPTHDTGGMDRAGAAYLIYGKASGFGTIDLGSLSPPDGAMIAGGEYYRVVGSLVTPAGDTNGDGLADFLIGAPSVAPNPYLAARAGSFELVLGQSSNLANSTYHGVTGVTNNQNDRVGSVMAGLGDLNGDGYDDFGVYSFQSTNPPQYGVGNGALFIYWGHDSGSPAPVPTVLGDFGQFLAPAGDFNGDGVDDLMAGFGVVYGRQSDDTASVFGASDPASLFASQGVRFTRAQGTDLIRQYASAGDVNGDGYDDVLIASYDQGTTRPGAAYLIYGRSDAARTIDLDHLGDSEGLIVKGPAGSKTPSSVAGIGDVNGDGFDDLIVHSNSGAYVIYGGTRLRVEIHGTAADDALDGTASADYLSAVAGDDHLNGGGGDDLLAPGAGNDVAYGDGGLDTLDYSLASGAIYGVLRDHFVNETALTSGTVIAATTVVTTDLFFEVENLIGSAFGDRLYGSAGNNVITPGAGADIAYGMGGNDTISYANAAGAVFLDLGAGTFVSETALTSGTVDAATPVVATDQVFGFANAEGSAFGDRLHGTVGDNVITPSAGADIVYGMGGSDTISYADAAGAVFLDLAGHTVWETGLTSGTVLDTTPVVTTDLVFGIANSMGSTFGDRLNGSNANNVLDGMDGADFLYGLEGADTLRGGNGADVIGGGDGADLIVGGYGNDVMLGGAGSDSFHWDLPGEGIDLIADFSVADDTLSFLGSAFGYGAGASAILVSNSNPVAAAPRSFLYDTDTGILSFDADGAGGVAAVGIAQLQGTPAITTADFLFV